MQILNIGPLELLLFIVIILIVLGPEDMVKTARSIGKFIYRITHSPIWKDIMETTQEIRDLPKKIVADTGLEETFKDINQTTNQVAKELNQSTSEIQQSSKVEVDVPVTAATISPAAPLVSPEAPVNSDVAKTNDIEISSVPSNESSPKEVIQAVELSQNSIQDVSDNSQLDTTYTGEDPNPNILEEGESSGTIENQPDLVGTDQTIVQFEEVVKPTEDPIFMDLNQPNQSNFITDQILDNTQETAEIATEKTLADTSSDQVMEVSSDSEENSDFNKVDPLIENS